MQDRTYDDTCGNVKGSSVLIFDRYIFKYGNSCESINDSFDNESMKFVVNVLGVDFRQICLINDSNEVYVDFNCEIWGLLDDASL